MKVNFCPFCGDSETKKKKYSSSTVCNYCKSVWIVNIIEEPKREPESPINCTECGCVEFDVNLNVSVCKECKAKMIMRDI